MTSYRYNGDGVRVAKEAAGQTTWFVQDVAREQPVVLHDGSAYYVWGHTLLWRVTPEGITQHYHQDGVGSVRAITSGAGDGPVGNVKAWYSYEAFGALRRESGSSPQALRYAGEWQDGETGLYHLRARQYDPATGRFTSTNSLTFVGSDGLFSASRRDPRLCAH